MYALLGQLAGNPAAARAVLTDRGRAAYLFGERDVLADDGAAIVAAAAAAAADVTPGASQRVQDDAALVASAFVNHFGARHAADVPADDDVGRRLAAILAAHLPAVEHALVSPDGDQPSGPRMGTVELSLDGRPPSLGALFDQGALGELVKAAARSGAGVVALREAVSAHQRSTAERTAFGDQRWRDRRRRGA